MDLLSGIHADVLLMDREDGTRVRVTIFSGPDFHSPHLERRAVFEDRETARWTADRAVEALELLGIPIGNGLPDGHEPAAALLPGVSDLGCVRVRPNLRSV